MTPEEEEILQNDLISVVLFGSAARGEAGEGSDIDILIVAEKFGTLISPVPFIPSEIENNPSILLDIVTDGIIIYDTDDFIDNKMKNLRKKL